MQLKEYQRRALETIRSYLELLAAWRKKAEDNPDLEIDFPAKAWGEGGHGAAVSSAQERTGAAVADVLHEGSDGRRKDSPGRQDG